MNTDKLWMVKPSEEVFFTKNLSSGNDILVIDNGIKDLSEEDNITPPLLKKLIKKRYPKYHDDEIASIVWQMDSFLMDFEYGDCIITYNPSQQTYAVGEIISQYKFDEKNGYNRAIKWIDNVGKQELSQEIQNTLRTTSNFSEIYQPIREEIFSLLIEKSKVPKIETFITKSHEFIKNKVLSLSEKEVLKLVTGILRAIGYKTQIKYDEHFVASSDGLGLEGESGKISVLVHHEPLDMNSKRRKEQIYSIGHYLCKLKTYEKFLFVSTMPISMTIMEEAQHAVYKNYGARKNIPVILVGLDDLVDLIIQHYDNFDYDTKTILPLKKIYWPI